MWVVGGRLQGPELVGYDLGWQKRQSHRLATDTVDVVIGRVQSLQSSGLNVPPDCLSEVKCAATLYDAWQNFSDCGPHCCLEVCHNCLYARASWECGNECAKYALVILLATSRHHNKRQRQLFQLTVLLHEGMDREQLVERIFDDLECCVDVSSLGFAQQL